MVVGGINVAADLEGVRHGAIPSDCAAGVLAGQRE